MMRVVREMLQEMTRKTEKMVKNSITKVWRKKVEDEGGKAEAGDDKEDREECEEPDT
jgi:hypothetical protein